MAESLIIAVAIVLSCAGLTALLIAVLTPTFFSRHFMAQPNERSSHERAVPQGAGLAIVASMLAIYVGLWALGHLEQTEPWPVPLLAAAVGLTILGALDDAVSLPVSWRLAGQAAAAFAVALNLPGGFQILPHLMPMVAERLMLVVLIVGFVNAVNFLDGIDWITVAQTVPITLAVIAMGFLGAVPENVGLLALVLLGGVLGFAFFNKHPARIFLGDAGSLPIGLCLAWLLIFVAQTDIAAALLLPLYTVCDVGLTLGRRVANGEDVFSGHKTHFYQRAVTLGFKVPDVTLRVFLLGVLLAGLSIAAVMLHWWVADLVLLMVGLAATAVMLRVLARGRS
jgi:UDP-N-acetylmuramyl pentapeptide phosphotransferase/UDP-N-acetylglucosamine-1-phosphate transferase